MTHLLEANKLCKYFESPGRENGELEVLKDISLEVKKNESIAIIGPSGEGKTVLLHLLGLLDEPSSGEVSFPCFQSQDPDYLRCHHIGFVFQNFSLIEELTVWQNVLLPTKIGKVKGMNLRYIEKKSRTRLERLGLSDRLHFKASLLSGGEKQRVAIARALCLNPELILADEPTGNLDHETSVEIHRLLLEQIREGGHSLVVVTHDLELANSCDSIYRLSDKMLSVQPKKIYPSKG